MLWRATKAAKSVNGAFVITCDRFTKDQALMQASSGRRARHAYAGFIRMEPSLAVTCNHRELEDFQPACYARKGGGGVQINTAEDY